MEYLFAPMEGITLSGFRRVHRQLFPGCTQYYTPFIAPDSKGAFKEKYLRDLISDREEVPVVPQLLVNNADAFHLTAVRLRDLGFREINLNAGCPSGTVFAKHKGSGLLKDPEKLDSLLNTVFNRAEQYGYRVSIKTRMGVAGTEEFVRILSVYRKYPLARLVVHARSRNDFYQGDPDLNGFIQAAECFNGPITYNGDLFNLFRFHNLLESYPSLQSVMIGRGAVANPGLIRSMQGGETLKASELVTFHNALLDAWQDDGLSPHYLMERMKNLMVYMEDMFQSEKKEKKAVFKAKNLHDYIAASTNLFCSSDFRPEIGYAPYDNSKM